MAAGEPDAKLLDAFVARSKERFDPVHGGFGYVEPLLKPSFATVDRFFARALKRSAGQHLKAVGQGRNPAIEGQSSQHA